MIEVIHKRTILYGYSDRKHKTMWAYPEDREFYVAGKTFVVPAHYEFDGATVPGLIEGLFSPTGVTFEAASLHDWLYDTWGLGHPLFSRHDLSRRDVDEIFFRHMLQDSTPKLQAQLMWLGVRTPKGKQFWDDNSYPDYLFK